MNTTYVLYAFYVLILVIVGVGEYVHILPTGTLSGLLGVIIGASGIHASNLVNNQKKDTPTEEKTV